MKRYLSFVLALLMMLAVLCSCMEKTEDDEKKENEEVIYVAETTSSNSDYGNKFAGKMKEYLGIDTQVTDKQKKASYIVGNGSEADELGVSFDGMQDGYIIRKIDDTVLILGGSDAATDYAIEYFFDEVIRSDGTFVEENINISDKSYRRINKLTVAGRDISEFTVVIPDDADDCAKYASEELVKYVEQACGAKLSIVKKSEAGNEAHAIELKIDPDGSLQNDGFTIKTDSNGIQIIGGFQRGCLYGVYELLEKYMGYRFLVRDKIYLYEAEAKDISAGINDTQIPTFKYRDVYTFTDAYYSNVIGPYDSKYTADTCVPRRINKYNDSKYGYASQPVTGVHTYPQFINTGFSAYDPNPCLTDETNINNAVTNVLKYIQDRIDAGYKIGVNFNGVPFSANDRDEWCTCKDCRALIRAADGSRSGPVIHITNIVARAVAEKYPGLTVDMLAYQSAIKAPKPEAMKCEDNVVVIFASLGSCSNHLYSGENCDPAKTNPMYNGMLGGNMREWEKICKETRVWYYLTNFSFGLTPLPIVYNLREDMQYCAENNATGIFAQDAESIFGFEDVTAYLMSKLLWNPYITAQEYEEILTEFLMLYYGDGYVNILRYIHMWTEAGDMMGCFNCCSLNTRPTTIVSCDYYADNYDLMKELFDAAKSEANYKQKKLLDVLFVHVDFLSLCCEYDRMEKGEEDRRDKVMEKYRNLYNYLKDNNLTILNTVSKDFVLPDEPEYDKNPCKSWYRYDYMTEYK